MGHPSVGNPNLFFSFIPGLIFSGKGSGAVARLKRKGHLICAYRDPGHCTTPMEGCSHAHLIRALYEPGLPLLIKTDRPEWTVFRCVILGNPVLTSIGETGGFAREKTGLFSAIWIEDLRLPCGAGSGGGKRLKEPLFS